jgi:hypothetical protein
LEKTGFRPQYAGLIPGLGQVIKYKILKNLGFVRHSPLFSLWPWPLLVRLADARFQVSAMPLGVAPDPEPPESEAPETEAAVRRA